MKIDEIIRSKRKTFALIVERDGRLVVRAPRRATKTQIRQLVAEKADWIRAKQAQAAANPLPAPKRFVAGELFYYLGERYPLQMVERQKGALYFDGQVFKLRRVQQCRAKEHFIAWYRVKARQVIGERLAVFAPRGNFEYKSLRITSAKTRWGSCGAGGTLNFPWRLVMAPSSKIDYVVVHELAHLKVHGHQKEFWDLVAAIMPDYKDHRRWFKENGHLLVF